MENLQIIEIAINKALEKGVFSSCKEISDILNAMQQIAKKITDNGLDDTNN